MHSTNKNKEQSLGLPLEYSSLAYYYDLLSQGNDNSVHLAIEKILKANKVKTVLDLTCGTGAQALWLARRGYQVVGSDQSCELLQIASKKSQDAGLDITFHQKDMRTAQLGHFDAIITIFNAIGHLTKQDFITALRNIKKNLKPGGIYIFDIFNLEALTDKVVKNLAMDIEKSINKKTIRHIQKSILNRSLSRLTSFDEFYIQEEKKDPEIIKNEFSLQIYTAEEIKTILCQTGFEDVKQYALDGSSFSNSKSESILTVGRNPCK